MMNRIALPLLLLCFSTTFCFADVEASGSEGKWSWQQPQAKVLPTGDLQWAPRPFEFKPGQTIRYIDFDAGADSNDGRSVQAPWKHHPWDPNATDNAKSWKGACTYVFRQGVDYRG